MAQVFERNCYTKIGVGLSSTANGDSPSLLITSTNNSADNHSHCFVGPGAGTNDDIIFCLNRNGGAYGRFDVEFNGIKRFFVAGDYQTNGGFGTGNNALNSKCQNILIGCGKNGIPASLFCSNSDLGAGEWNYPASALAPSQAANSQIVNMVGRELASCNAAYIGLKYCGDHSSANYLFLGMYGSDAIIAGMPNGDVGIGTHYGKVTGTLPADACFGRLTVYGETASEGDFNSYPGHTSVGVLSTSIPTPKECKPDLIVCRPFTQSSPPAYTNNLRGQIAIGLGVGIYSVNPNIGGGPFYGDIRFYTSCYDTNYCTIDRMTITCAGCIGIGTNYPTSGSILDIRGGNVHIDGGSVTDRQLYFRNQSQGTVGGSVRSDQTLSLFAGVGSSPTQAVTIERETLHVGIGTADPSRRLSVLGVGNSTVTTIITPSTNGGTFGILDLKRQDNAINSSVGVRFSHGNSAAVTNDIEYGFIGGGIEVATAGSEEGFLNFAVGPSRAEKMRINSNGAIERKASGGGGISYEFVHSETGSPPTDLSVDITVQTSSSHWHSYGVEATVSYVNNNTPRGIATFLIFFDGYNGSVSYHGNTVQASVGTVPTLSVSISGETITLTFNTYTDIHVAQRAIGHFRVLTSYGNVTHS